MTDEAYVFNQTNRERAILKRSSANKKRGSKSKKCKLEVDRMSKKEIEKHHGPVQTWKMTEFYSWDEFKAMPKDIQAEYINYLQLTYNIGFTTISKELFGLEKSGTYNYCMRHGILNHINRWPKSFKAKKEDLEAFKTAVGKANTVFKEGDKCSIVESDLLNDDTYSSIMALNFTSDRIDYAMLRKIESLFEGRRITVSVSITLEGL